MPRVVAHGATMFTARVLVSNWLKTQGDWPIFVVEEA